MPSSKESSHSKKSSRRESATDKREPSDPSEVSSLLQDLRSVVSTVNSGSRKTGSSAGAKKVPRDPRVPRVPSSRATSVPDGPPIRGVHPSGGPPSDASTVTDGSRKTGSSAGAASGAASVASGSGQVFRSYEKICTICRKKYVVNYVCKKGKRGEYCRLL